MQTVLLSVLTEGWARPPGAVRELLAGVAAATAQTLDVVKTHLLPTPLKCHYTFDLRDAMRVAEGLLMADSTSLTDGGAVARWAENLAARRLPARRLGEGL